MMNDELLQLVLSYGVLVLAPVLLGAAIGLPLPASLLMVAVGAFARADLLNLPLFLLCAVGATLAGNAVGYAIGRRGGAGALARWSARFKGGEAAIGRAERLFARRGGAAVLLSRFPLSPLSAVINILAGVGRYPFRAFALYNLLGVTLWAGFYAGAGYAFSASWDVLADLLGSAAQALTLLVVIAALVVLLLRTLKHRYDETHPHQDPTEEVVPLLEPDLQPGEQRVG